MSFTLLVVGREDYDESGVAKQICCLALRVNSDFVPVKERVMGYDR